MDLYKLAGLMRQALAVALLLATCAFVSACRAKPQKPYNVAILCGAEPFADIGKGFKEKMTELGYVEGKNIVYDYKNSNSDPAGEERIVKNFIADKVDLVFVFPGGSATTTKATLKGTTISIVFAMAGIEGNDLVESVSHPGDRITGVRFPSKEITSKRLEVLHELAPEAQRIYLLYDAIYPNTQFALETLRATAASLELTLVEDKAHTIEEYKLALQERGSMDDVGIDAIFLMPDYLNHSPDGFGTMVAFADALRLPIGGGMDFTADGGAMFSFVPDNKEQGRLAAILADKIMHGVPAGTIPVVTPECRLRINYKAIQDLGLDAPAGLLRMAKEIIR